MLISAEIKTIVIINQYAIRKRNTFRYPISRVFIFFASFRSKAVNKRRLDVINPMSRSKCAGRYTLFRNVVSPGDRNFMERRLIILTNQSRDTVSLRSKSFKSISSSLAVLPKNQYSIKLLHNSIESIKYDNIMYFGSYL